MRSPPRPPPDEPPFPRKGTPPTASGDASPLSDTEQRERSAYIERNLWVALVGLLLFFLAL